MSSQRSAPSPTRVPPGPGTSARGWSMRVQHRSAASPSRDIVARCALQMPRVASLTIVNGNVWLRPGLTAVAVDGDRIVAVGRDKDMPRGAGLIDAAGATLIPAFNDAHVHFLIGSRA